MHSVVGKRERSLQEFGLMNRIWEQAVLTSCHVGPGLNGHVSTSPPEHHTVHTLICKIITRESLGYKGNIPQTSTPAKAIDVCLGCSPVCLGGIAEACDHFYRKQ